jgi:hypothetical protein
MQGLKNRYRATPSKLVTDVLSVAGHAGTDTPHCLAIGRLLLSHRDNAHAEFQENALLVRLRPELGYKHMKLSTDFGDLFREPINSFSDPR